MKRWRSKRVVLFLAVLAVPLYFVACGGSGSSHRGVVATAELSTESVETWLAGVEESIPGCVVVEEVVPAPVPAQVATSPIRALAVLADQIFPLGKTPETAPTESPEVSTSSVLPFSWEFAGDCGGTLSLTWKGHQSGVTTYTVEALDFCMLLAEEEAAPLTATAEAQAQLAAVEGGTVINGVMDVVEIGTPSDSGPIISKVTADIPDVVTITTPDDELTLSGEASYTFGTPGVVPASPTEAKPDTLYVSQVALGFGEDKIEVKNLTVHAWESPVDPTDATIDNTVVDVVGGYYVTTSGRVALLGTDTPLQINDDFELVAGTLDVTGAGGTSMTISASETPGVFEFLVNDEPLGKKLDCSGAFFFLEDEVVR